LDVRNQTEGDSSLCAFVGLTWLFVESASIIECAHHSSE
jgi:hypothetical protein